MTAQKRLTFISRRKRSGPFRVTEQDLYDLWLLDHMLNKYCHAYILTSSPPVGGSLAAANMLRDGDLLLNPERATPPMPQATP